eukprot:4013534-Pleurochrysis_carterae.AAC.1
MKIRCVLFGAGLRTRPDSISNIKMSTNELQLQAHHEHDDVRRCCGIPGGALHRPGKSRRKAQDVEKRQSAQGAKQEMPG